VRYPLPKQTEDKVQDDGEHKADYDAGHYREEELKVPFLHKYVARKPSQERNSLPEEQQQAEEHEKSSTED
jgi:hypothetical protein